MLPVLTILFLGNARADDKDFHVGYTSRRCTGGKIEQKVLNDIGVSEENLRTGVQCLEIDLDKNGSKDYVIYGVPKNEKCSDPGRSVPTRPFKLVMLDRNKVLFTKVIAQRCYDSIDIYPEDDPNRLFKGKNKRSVLVQWGEGAESYYYYWDPAKKSLRKISTPGD